MITTALNPTVRLAWRLPNLQLSDEEDGCAEDPVREMEVGASVEGMSVGFDAGLMGNSDGKAGDKVGADSGDCTGEALEASGANGVSTEEGAGIEGDSCGAGLRGEAVGAVEGARVSTSSFIPWLQCPVVPQMKYLLPGEDRGMVVLPPL